MLHTLLMPLRHFRFLHCQAASSYALMIFLYFAMFAFAAADCSHDASLAASFRFAFIFSFLRHASAFLFFAAAADILPLLRRRVAALTLMLITLMLMYHYIAAMSFRRLISRFMPSRHIFSRRLRC